MKQSLQDWRSTTAWRHRDLRVVGPARALSVLGDEIALVSLLLRVHDTGGGPRGVTLLLGAAAIPTILLAPWSGRLADRVDSRRLAVGSALLQMGACVALALTISPWLLYPLVMALQAGQAVANPTWGALVPRIVGEDDIARATGSLTALTSLAAVAGPAIGGLLTGVGGARLPLLVDSATFGVLAAAALVVRTRRGGAAAVEAGSPRALDGLRLIARDLVLRPVFGVLMAFVAVGEATNVVEVFLVRDTLGGSSAQYGVVGMAAGAGIVGGSLLGGRDTSLAGRVRWVVVGAGGTALMVLAAGASPSVLAFAGAWAVLGVANGLLNTSASTLLLIRAPEAARGQVIAAATGASRAFSIAALLLGGALGTVVGPRPTFLLCGAAALVVTGVLSFAVRWAWHHVSEPEPVSAYR